MSFLALLAPEILICMFYFIATMSIICHEMCGFTNRRVLLVCCNVWRGCEGCSSSLVLAGNHGCKIAGKRKGTREARLPTKILWMRRMRVLRRLLRPNAEAPKQPEVAAVPEAAAKPTQSLVT
uniref:Ribosomal protein L19e C-terminal domain-containing protein n=1 Tax=Chenopodium quinoa TaxID=63459 RepID=A0A803M287_CHEQI